MKLSPCTMYGQCVCIEACSSEWSNSALKNDSQPQIAVKFQVSENMHSINVSFPFYQSRTLFVAWWSLSEPENSNPWSSSSDGNATWLSFESNSPVSPWELARTLFACAVFGLRLRAVSVSQWRLAISSSPMKRLRSSSSFLR